MRSSEFLVRRAVADNIFEHICEAAPDGIVVVDADGMIVMVNARAEQQFGYERGEIVGEPVEILVPSSLRGTHVRHRQGFVAHPTARPMASGLALRAQRRDGTEFPAEISLSPFHASGKQLVVSVIRDITERRRLEEEREHLRTVAERERERQRIAMDLHDGVIQSIYAAALQLEAAVEDVNSDPAGAVAEIERTIDLLNDTIRDIRSYILDLRPPRYGDDLIVSLKQMMEEFRANSLIATSEDISESLPPLSEEQESAIFHVAQEALNNARKHSRATHLALTLQAVDGLIRLRVRDNGRGFEPGEDTTDAHDGLRNMLERASAASAAFRVETQPGAGTQVTLEIPVGDKARRSGSATEKDG